MRVVCALVLSLVAGLVGCQEKVEEVSPQQLQLAGTRGRQPSERGVEPKPKPAPKSKPKPAPIRDKAPSRTDVRRTPAQDQRAAEDDAPAEEPRVYRAEIAEGTFQFVQRQDGKWNVLSDLGARLGTMDVRSRGVRYLDLKHQELATVALKDYGCKVSDKRGPFMRIWRKEGAYAIYDLDGKALGSISSDRLTLGTSVVSVRQTAGRIFLSHGAEEMGRIMPARYPEAAMFMGVTEWPFEVRAALFLYWIIHVLP